jgi:hypothetical protein
MKTKIATALSLVGVLGAGSAAALVNTQILDSGPAGADTSAILTPSAAPQQASTTAASTSSSTTAATSTTVATIAPVVVTPAPAPAGSPLLTSYNLGASGLVTVDVVAGVATLVAATPNPGWTLAASEADATQNKVEVTFTDGTTLVELEVRFDGAQLVPQVSSSLVGATANTTANTTTRNTVDDDDDDTDNTIDDDTDNTIDDDDDDDDDEDDDHGGDDDDDDDD